MGLTRGCRIRAMLWNQTAENAMTALQVNWEHVGSVLVVFLVISVVFETALTPFFNWCLFALHFEGSG